MIAQKHRVPKEFIPQLLKSGESYRSDLFIIRYKENEKQFNRYRVIISKKIDPKAVKRNKLRRQVYEAIRVNSVENIEGKDMILIPKKIIGSKSYAEIEKDISKNITKNG
jgi:ribonuclease P protein component